MSDDQQAPSLPLLLRLFRFPLGTALLLTVSARRRLRWFTLGFVALSLLDTAGVLAMVPLMEVIAGLSIRSGLLGHISRLFGTDTRANLLTTLAGLVVVAFMLKGLCSVWFRHRQLHLMAEQETELSTSLITGFLRGPYTWHLDRNAADMMWIVEGAVPSGYTTPLTAALGAGAELVTISAVVAALLVVNPLPTLLAVIYFGGAGFVIQRLLRHRLTVVSEQSVQTSMEAGKAIHHAFGAVKEIRVRRAEKHFIDGYRAPRLRNSHARASASLYTEAPKYVLEVIFVSGIALLTIVVTTFGGPTDALVTLGLFVAAGSRVLPSAVRMLSAISGIRIGRRALEYLIDETRLQDEAKSREHSRVLTAEIPRGVITLRDVRFAYTDPGTEVLRGVSAEVAVGQSIALVGSSGAGKSTLVDLLLGLHQPSSGSITAGAIDIHDNLPGWQRQLAVVPQEVYLLDDTLTRNIAFEADLNKERLQSVVERAQLSDLVSAMPMGMETILGDRGVRLSGGQRQRIGIARALYRDPEVLILDEATSALDNETERRLTETIHALKGTMTMVIVAHRLSTVRDCDEVLFMSAGRVVSRGTFDEVAQDSPEFAHLVELGSLRRSGA